MARLRVGIVRGGIGSEYEVSLKTGASVLRNLDTERYDARDVLIAKDGTWSVDGMPFTPDRLRGHIDVAFNALHGEYGEDGTIQRLFDSLMIPYTGSTAFPSALGMNKMLSKATFKQLGLKVPFGETYTRAHGSAEEIARAAWSRVPCPWVVKPANLGSSVGVSIAKDFSQLLAAVEKAFEHAETILIEEFIKGREATAGVVDNLRGHEHYALPVVQIIKPDEKEFFDYEAKYTGITQEICPGHFTDKEHEEIRNAAVAVHKGLGLRHYSRTDFIVSPRGIFVLEVNTQPGLTSESLLPKSLDAVGVTYSQFLDHVISLALRR